MKILGRIGLALTALLFIMSATVVVRCHLVADMILLRSGYGVLLSDGYISFRADRTTDEWFEQQNNLSGGERVVSRLGLELKFGFKRPGVWRPGPNSHQYWFGLEYDESSPRTNSHNQVYQARGWLFPAWWIMIPPGLPLMMVWVQAVRRWHRRREDRRRGFEIEAKQASASEGAA